MGLSLISILAFVVVARSVPNAVRSPSGSKGEQIPIYAHLKRSLLPGCLAVIAQMFEWNWDSVAAECTSFLGPAGYGFVQGESEGFPTFPRPALFTVC
jgi:hypothetical protein